MSDDGLDRHLGLGMERMVMQIVRIEVAHYGLINVRLPVAEDFVLSLILWQAVLMYTSPSKFC